MKIVTTRPVSLVALALTLSACSATGPDAADRLAGTTPPPSASAGAPGDWNHDDIAFVQMMIPHHAQALTMARLAPTRAGARVREAAARIEAAQGPEILLLASWLQSQGVQVPRAGESWTAYDHADHGHAGMAGMLTDRQLEALGETSGAPFDRLFLTDMIAHHEGALAMAQQVLAHGRDQRVNELASDIVAGQSAEISRLRTLLAQVG